MLQRQVVALPWFPPMSHITTNSSDLHSLNKLQKGPQVLQKQLPCLLLLLYKWIYAHYNVTLHTETCCQTMSNVLIQDSTR